MINEKVKEAFWEVVEDCLVEFHGLKSEEAEQKSDRFREMIEECRPRGSGSDIFYHSEPFQVACDLMEADLDLAKYRSEYDRILVRHNW